MSELVLLKYITHPDSTNIEFYEKMGGYQGLKKILTTYSPDKVIDTIKASNLRGRGGAGFPTGLKWSFVPKDDGKIHYLCCNADEGEPGTFKDRRLMERDPHRVIEGMIIAAYAIQAKVAYIYIRGEYGLSIAMITLAINAAYAKGYLGQHIFNSDFCLDIYVHKGAGAYICGEETALLESIEGRRGQPKLKPPFPAVSGLYDCPTVINNVETFVCVAHILARGVDWFTSIGPEDAPGPRLFGLSGQLQNPGIVELPMGLSLRELVYDYGGGPLSGEFKAVIPGGLSAPMIPLAGLDVKMNFADLATADSMMGSAAVIALDETASIPAVGRRIAEFFAHESCGKCAPCREGLPWASKILNRIERGQGRPGDVEQLQVICSGVFDNSFCALGVGAAWALRATLTHFRHEYDALITAQTIPVNDRTNS